MSTVSVVIRTLNEATYLSELLEAIDNQSSINFDVEKVIVDSGSTDDTIAIANSYNCSITYIEKEQFTFGRSLNIGCEFAKGEILIFISGHCIPASKSWLSNLIRPLVEKGEGYTYGRQIGRDTTKFSELQIFKKYFPESLNSSASDFFCNNANSAIARSTWSRYRFDENITGLEDMDLAKKYFIEGGKVEYIPNAPVYHIHDETWRQTRRRYEREAIALQAIMPEVQVSLFDAARYIFTSIFSDLSQAYKEKIFLKEFLQVIKFRLAQYSGTYRGNHFIREISREKKEKYYYPK